MQKVPDRQITAGGETLIFRFSFRAFQRMQEHFEVKTLREVASVLAAGNLAAGDFAAICWAGLASHHKQISKEDAFDIADEIGVMQIQSIMNDAFVGATSEADRQEGGEGKTDSPRKPGQSKK